MDFLSQAEGDRRTPLAPVFYAIASSLSSLVPLETVLVASVLARRELLPVY